MPCLHYLSDGPVSWLFMEHGSRDGACFDFSSNSTTADKRRPGWRNWMKTWVSTKCWKMKGKMNGDTCKLNVSVCEFIIWRATPGFTQPKVRSCKIISAKLGRTEREGEKWNVYGRVICLWCEEEQKKTFWRSMFGLSGVINYTHVEYESCSTAVIITSDKTEAMSGKHQISAYLMAQTHLLKCTLNIHASNGLIQSIWSFL